MLVTQINNHVATALSQLLQQYQGQPRITGLITALVAQIQNLENALYPIDAGRQLYNGNAVGTQLDNLGTLIGLPRNGLPDNEYLVLLLGTIAEDNSDTTQSTLINIVQTLFEATNVFVFTPNSPGNPHYGRVNAVVSFSVGGAQIPSSLYTIIENIILNSIAAGVSLVYLSTHNASYAFSTSGPQAWCSGCSDLNNPKSTDGQIASLIYNNSVQ